MPIVTNDAGRENDILKASPGAPAPFAVPTLQITSHEYRGVSVDTRWTPRTNLLVHIEGYAWSGTYYSQVVDIDSQLSGQQYTASPVYQQYTKIVQMEMRVTTPLTQSQDDTTKVVSLTGSATTYPFLIPNEGDMWVADIGEGRLGVFRITGSVKKSIFKEACYEISYSLDTDQSDKIADLEQKTVKTVYFHKDFINYGQSPLLMPSAHTALLELDKVYATLTRQYFRRFFSQEYQTMLVPGQGTLAVYDSFLTEYLLSQFTTWDSPEIRKIRQLNVDDDETMHCDSLWRALREKDQSYMNVAFKRAGLLSTSKFSMNPAMESIRYTGIDLVVYPIDPVLTVDGLITNPSKTPSPFLLTPAIAAQGENNTMVRALNLQAAAAPVISGIYPVTVDDYYVLSANFYNKTAQQSTLEALVWTFLDGGSLDLEQLLNTAKRFTQWGALEQFYYTPIIMTLIRSIKRGL